MGISHGRGLWMKGLIGYGNSDHAIQYIKVRSHWCHIFELLAHREGNWSVIGWFPSQRANIVEKFPIHYELWDNCQLFQRNRWNSLPLIQWWFNELEPLTLNGLTVIPAWISKVWDEINHPFPNVNSGAIGVCEWIDNFTPRFMMDVITYPCWN